jgi:hypothetical protein
MALPSQWPLATIQQSSPDQRDSPPLPYQTRLQDTKLTSLRRNVSPFNQKQSCFNARRVSDVTCTSHLHHPHQ